MSRFELGGHEGPNPIEALPSEFSADAAAYLLSLPNGVDFVPADYMFFGYTHYEVTCIGGAGGRGGDSAQEVHFDQVTTGVAASGADWTRWKEMLRLSDFYTAGEWDHGYLYGIPGHEIMTVSQAAEYFNPGHLIQVTTYSNPRLVGDLDAGRGGSGGGGGMHVVTGALADLAAAVPVVVGAAGADAAVGQTTVNGPWTPLPFNMTLSAGSHSSPYPLGRLHELSDYFNAYMYKYPGSHGTFANPAAGSNGGASSFGGTLCRASGGKGGAKSKVWSGSAFVPDAAGGQGGIGNQATAGGGAAGSTSEAPGSDGNWDGAIGKGGGGGRGGSASVPRQPSNGGQGSYSFADTSVYGPRQPKSGWVGGGGGGAHRGTWKRGSHALGYSPEGIVLIRIYKVE